MRSVKRSTSFKRKGLGDVQRSDRAGVMLSEEQKERATAKAKVNFSQREMDELFGVPDPDEPLDDITISVKDG